METPTTFEIMTGLVVLTPLLSSVLCLLIPDRYSWMVTILASFLMLISAAAGFCVIATIPSNQVITSYIEWFQINQVTLNANIELNRLSVLMLPLVTGISFLVHLYSIGYMAGDTAVKRYFAMLGFFTFSMLGIVLSDNLVMLFVFWELVGFSSYILIGHWTQKPAAAAAAKKAFIFNRIGDAGFLVGIMIVWSNTSHLDLSYLLHLSWQSTAAALCIFCGIIGKSAQLPLFSWLPDAMEGPTPVSALIHAATMVAAGVFLLVRISPMFTTSALHVVTLVGITTAFLAGLSALHQFDIKKILAYSTISQLGLMVTAVGVGAGNAAMLHLFSHAFFKAALFLSIGSVIHVLHQSQQQTHTHFDVQDIRNLGGLRKKMPYTFLVFLISGASLAGIPLLSGFLSKDSIITGIWNWAEPLKGRWIVVIAAFIISFITARYIFRMMWYMFFGEPKHNTDISESPWIMRIPMLMLAGASIWFITSINPIVVSGWFTSLIGNIEHSFTITLLSFSVVSLALITSWFSYTRREPRAANFVQGGYGVDVFYEKIIGKSVQGLSVIAQTADRKWIDGVLHFAAYANVSVAHFIAWVDRFVVDGFVNAIAWFGGLVGTFTRSFQGGKIQLYIFWAVLGLIIFIFFMLI